MLQVSSFKFPLYSSRQVGINWYKQDCSCRAVMILFCFLVAEIFGIAIYGMFLAIIIPKARESRPVLEVVLIAAILSCVIYYVPFIRLSSGLSITLCAVVAAAYGAWRHPLPAEAEEDDVQNGITVLLLKSLF